METMKFDELGIDERILRAVTEMGFEEASPIQTKSIPVLLDGKDAFDNDVERTKLFYLSDNFYFPVASSIKSAAKFYANYFPQFDFKILNSVLDSEKKQYVIHSCSFNG